MRAHASEEDGEVQRGRSQVAPGDSRSVDTSEVTGSNPGPRITWPKIVWGERLGREGSPYLKRWVFDFGAFSIRLHHWLRSDDTRAPHDHEWDFVSILLAGKVVDRTPRGTGGYIDGEPSSWLDATRTRGVPQFFTAEHRHCVVVGAGGAWTLLLTGNHRREWGFWTPRRDGSGTVRFRKRNKYFREHGHH